MEEEKVLKEYKPAGYFGALEEEYESLYDIGQLHIKETFYSKYVKRLLDILISLAAVIVTFPINIVIGIATYFSLGRPIFFVHERPGLGEKPFKVVKFRNMTNEMDSAGRLLPPAKRVTVLGNFFRRTSLDELLEFWLILTGKMSIIGPRPLLMSYLPRYNARQHLRHAVKPGLECPLPEYAGEISWETRLENDVWYVENISFKTDCIMFCRLIKLVFNRRRSTLRGEKIDSEFGINHKNVMANN